MASHFNRSRFAAAVGTAFLCGLVFASSFDLTRFGFAQEGKGTKVASSQVQSLAETGSAFEAIAEHVTPSVVSIQTTRFPSPRTRGQRAPGSLEDFFRNFEQQQRGGAGPKEQPELASGSGFIVSKDGYILTNNHVVADADTILVTLLDKRTFSARVIGRDPSTDVAVIKIDGKDLPVVALGDDNASRVGQWVVAIGNPLGLDFTVTAGIISAKGRPLPNLLEGRYAITDYLQTDAAINPGNSGGPLVNIRGEVIGINSAIASQTGMYAGYGFAIPVTLAKQVMDDLIAYGKVRRSVIGVGIQNATPEEARAAHLSTVTGVTVSSYSYDADSVSAAKNAGIEPGDVIVAADGKPVDRVSTLQRIVRSHRPGETLGFDVMRFGDKKSFRVKLMEAPDETKTVASNTREQGDPDSPAPARQFDKVGISVTPLQPAMSAHVEAPYRQGLLVSDVSVQGPSFRKMGEQRTILYEVLNPGPRHLLHTPQDLDAVLSKLKKGDTVSFLVLPTSKLSRDTPAKRWKCSPI